MINYNWEKHCPKIAWKSIFLAVFIYISFLCLSYYSFNSDQLSLSSILALTILQYMNFTCVHEAGHGNIVSSNHPMHFVEGLIGWISSLFFHLIPFRVFAYVHDRHHAFTNEKSEDPDSWMHEKKISLILLKGATLISKYLHYAYVEKKSDPEMKKNVLSSICYYFVIFCVLLFFISIERFDFYFTYMIVPTVIAVVLLAISFDWIPHKPHENIDRYYNTRIYQGPFLKYLLLGQNYHLIHHLYPRVPWYFYETTFKEIEKDLRQKEVLIESLNPKSSDPFFLSTNPKTKIKEAWIISSTNQEKYNLRIHDKSISVNSNKVLLDQLLENEIEVSYACRKGKCGRCRVRLVKGEVDRLENVILNNDEKQAKQILTCTSLAKSDLTIESI